MLEFLDPREDVWQAERGGTWRMIHARRNGWDGINLGVRTPIINYINAVEAQHTGVIEWSRRRFPESVWGELESRGML